MALLSRAQTAAESTIAATPTPIRICMHVRERARADVRVMREARTLAAAGFAVSILDVEREPGYPTEEDFGAVHVQHILKPHWHTPTRMPWRLFRSAAKLIYSTALLLRMPAEIYHAHDVNALPSCYIAARLRRKALVFDAHELPLKELYGRAGWSRMLLRRLLTSMLARCAGVITVSPPIAQEMGEQYGVGKIELVRNIPAYWQAPGADRTDHLRHALGLAPEVRIALYQGNIQEGRGLELLVRAAAFLDPQIAIVIMGRSFDDTLTRLRALIASEGVAECVHILPPVPYAELLSWTASADVGLTIFPLDYSPSISMSLPNKLFEYLMAGLPVLSTPLEAIIDILQRYDVGRVAPSLDPADIAAALNALLANRDALERMRRNALEAVQDDLCWEKEQQHLIRLYQRIFAASS